MNSRPEFNHNFFLFTYEGATLCYRKEDGREAVIYFVQGKDYDGVIHHESVANRQSFPEIHDYVGGMLLDAAFFATSNKLYDELRQLEFFDVFNASYANSLDPSYVPEDEEEIESIFAARIASLDAKIRDLRDIVE